MTNVIKMDEVKCSICSGFIEPQRHPVTKEVFWTHGHSAEPVSDGRCCDNCNSTVVIAARLQEMGYEV